MENIFKKDQYQKGFTLVELIVVTAIVVVMLTIVLINYRSAGDKQALEIAVRQAINDLRFAQNAAMSGLEFEGNIPKGGWGVFFDRVAPGNNKYIVYADMDCDMISNTGCEYNPSVDNEYKEVKLTKGVTILGILIPVPVNDISVTFQPPKPNISIMKTGGVTPASGVRIDLSNNSGSKAFVVDKFGLIKSN